MRQKRVASDAVNAGRLILGWSHRLFVQVNGGVAVLGQDYVTTDKPAVDEANLYGGQMALKWTALVPLAMAVGYLLLVLYFLAKGGYTAVHLDEEPVGPAEY